MKHFLVTISFLSLLAGCASWTPEPVKEAMKPAPPPPVEKPRAKPEYGSLWTVDSRWNDIYAAAPSRQNGDSLSVKVSDAMRTRLLALVPADQPKPEDPKDKEKEKEKKSDEKKDQRGSREESADHLSDTRAIEVVVKEVYPRGVFRIGGTATVRIGPRSLTVALDGKIHEKDIASDDSVPADSIFGMSLENVPAVNDVLHRLTGEDRAKAAMAEKPEEKK